MQIKLKVTILIFLSFINMTTICFAEKSSLNRKLKIKWIAVSKITNNVEAEYYFNNKWEKAESIIFAKYSNPPGNATNWVHRLRIYRIFNDKWFYCDIKDKAFLNHCWNGVFVSKDQTKLWAFSEWGSGDPGWCIEIIFSNDGGYSWSHLSTINKPAYWFMFNSFKMNSEGNGQLVLYADFDDELREEIKQGYYIYMTDNWGLNWTEPEYHQDILKKARWTYYDDEASLSKLLKSLNK